MESAYIIWNPVAGKSKDLVYRRVAERFTEAGIPFASAMSEHVGHATELAKAAVAAGEKTIVVLGGDGTVREVASALVHTDAALGIIPCGSGNDLARPLGIPTDVDRAVDILLNGTPRAMDAGLANGTYFFNVAGFGFDVDVLQAIERYRYTMKSGSMAYLRGLIECLKHLPLYKTRITTPEGTDEKNVLILAAANGSHFGGGMQISPRSDLFDGKLSICIVHSVKWYHIPIVLPALLMGKHVRLTKYVTTFDTTELTAVCTPESRMEVDGEIMPGTPVTFRILPAALNVIR